MAQLRSNPGLRVELLDGTVWYGYIKAFDADPEDVNRGIVLGAPLRRGLPGSSVEDRPIDRQVVVLPEAQIKSIEASYPSTSNEVSTH